MGVTELTIEMEHTGKYLNLKDKKLAKGYVGSLPTHTRKLNCKDANARQSKEIKHSEGGK